MKKIAQRFLYFALFFTLFFVVVNSIFLALIATTDWDFVKRRESLNWEKPSYEMLILGTSLAEYGIDAEILSSEGIESFNLAFVGSSVKTNYIQLEEYLTLYPDRPEYVMLAQNSHLEPFDMQGIQPVVEFTMKGHKYGMKDVPISKFNWAGMELLKKAIRPSYRKVQVSYGQKRGNGKVPDYSEFHEIYLDKQKYEEADWMGEMAKLCMQNGIELILVDMPGVKETQNLSEIGPHTIQFSNGSSAQLYNFNTQEFCTFLDVENDWGGLSHLNKQGAAKFTRELLQVIPLDISKSTE